MSDSCKIYFYYNYYQTIIKYLCDFFFHEPVIFYSIKSYNILILNFKVN